MYVPIAQVEDLIVGKKVASITLDVDKMVEIRFEDNSYILIKPYTETELSIRGQLNTPLEFAY